MGKHFGTLLLGILFLFMVEQYGKCSCDQLVGGMLSEKDANANPDIQNMVTMFDREIRQGIRSQKKGQYLKEDTIVPISYRTQMVNGINYFIKIQAKVGKRNAYYHLRIFKSLKGVPSYVGLKGPLGNLQGIEYF